MEIEARLGEERNEENHGFVPAAAELPVVAHAHLEAIQASLHVLAHQYL